MDSELVDALQEQWKDNLRALEGNFTSARTSNSLTMSPLVSSSSTEVGGTGTVTDSESSMLAMPTVVVSSPVITSGSR